MYMYLSLGIMLAFFVGAGFQRRIYNRNMFITPRVLGIMGIAAAGIVWYFPVYGHPSLGLGWVDICVRSVLSTIQLFAADGFKELPVDLFTSLPRYYTIYGGFIALSAPFFTFALILSCFKAFNAYSSYRRFWKKACIFSELNDKSLAMANSIKNGRDGKRCIIVFADIVDKNEERHLDLVDGAKELNAVLFRKDLEAIRWAWFPRHLKRTLNFYLISDDESEKIRQTKFIVKNYNSQKCSLYVFSDAEESKNLLISYNTHKDKYPIHLNLMRIDAVRLLTYSYLDKNGEKLFKRATEIGGLKIINATIVGMGKYGSEMLKALMWFCQMPGYKINIKVIDRDERSRAKFEASFPGIEVGESHDSEKDIRYQIEFITATFGERGFIDAVSELPENNYFFVSLGDDETNMLASTAIRCAREQAGKTNDPHTEDDGDIVTTIIYSSDIKDLVFPEVKGCPEVNVIGDLNSFYSRETIGENELLTCGYNEHLLWSHIYNIRVVGFGHNELRALKTLVDLVRACGYKTSVCIYGASDKTMKDYDLRDKYGIEYETSTADRLFADLSLGDSLVICLNSRRNSDCARELANANIPFLKFHKDLFVKSYFATRFRERKEITRNEYQLSAYNFNSSIAKALHRRLRPKIQGLYEGEIHEALSKTGDYKGANKALQEIENQTDEKEILARVSEIEHIRWNAYMRSEGFVYNRKCTRFKMHDKLVSLDELTREDRLKDI